RIERACKERPVRDRLDVEDDVSGVGALSHASGLFLTLRLAPPRGTITARACRDARELGPPSRAAPLAGAGSRELRVEPSMPARAWADVRDRPRRDKCRRKAFDPLWYTGVRMRRARGFGPRGSRRPHQETQVGDALARTARLAPRALGPLPPPRHLDRRDLCADAPRVRARPLPHDLLARERRGAPARGGEARRRA